MNQQLHHYIEELQPYRDVIRFMVVLIVAHFCWKFTVIGDETTGGVTFFGCDISAPFTWLSYHIALAVHTFLQWFGYPATLYGNVIRFDTGGSVAIIWACSGLKQMFIFACIMLSSRGPWKHKLWFVPLGVILCHCINVTRIALLTLVVYYRPEWFYVSHEYVSKYLFYLIIFGIWVWWQECYNRTTKDEKQMA